MQRLDPTCVGEVSSAPNAPWEEGRCLRRLTTFCPQTPNLTQTWTLPLLIDFALKNNPTTHQAWADARAAAYNYRASQSSLYPALDLIESFTVSDNQSSFHHHAGAAGASSLTNGYSQVLDSTLSLSYLLFDFGGREGQIEAACHALASANFTHHRTLQSVMIHVYNAYFGYLAAHAAHEAKEKDLTNAKATLDAVNKQFQVGLSMRVDVLQAKTNLVNRQLELQEVIGHERVARGEVAKSLGLPAQVQLNMAILPPVLPTDQVVESVDALIAKATSCRPDLAAKQAAWETARAKVRIADSAQWPVLTTQVNGYYNDYAHTQLHDSKGYAATLQLSVPLFAGFLYRNQVRQAEEIVASSYADWKERESTVFLEVLTSLTAFETAAENLKYTDDYLSYAEEAYEAAMMGYRAGTSTVLDVLATESVLAKARAERIRARTKWVIALAELAYSTGTLTPKALVLQMEEGS